ncbi:TetR/AcrR family transcriptional regulator [Sphaerisporangium sp. TRM90804]|uniref:TetR/AcrR family transcriptional regulator n=1 Tax=Sphaerisporangium sp. TRM90804 TaxID=3031113 RepID=UPI002446BB7F|nr:TetR/AcrR family transcriptional regulator [Sphaerisporangium sp. TRM90804]MDH2426124.1 TetR/AcrR family transcriptional regulator [Sphaerisporangium sp. TRM90804]
MGRPKGFDPDAAVEQAMQVFWRQGYGATSPQDLLDELGIGKGSLYNAFGSKHELFARALRRYNERIDAELAEMLERPGSVKERLGAALEGLVRADYAARRGCLAVNTAVELPGSDEAVRLVRRMFDREELVLRTMIEEGQRSGELRRDVDAAAVASMLLSTIAGLRVLSKVTATPAPLDRAVGAIIALL